MTPDATNLENVLLESSPHLHNLRFWRRASCFSPELENICPHIYVPTGGPRGPQCVYSLLCRDVTGPRGKYGTEREKRSPDRGFWRNLQLGMTRCRFSFQGSDQLAQLLQAPDWPSAL